MTNEKDLTEDMQDMYNEMLDVIDAVPTKYLVYIMQESGIIPDAIPKDKEYYKHLFEAQLIVFLIRNFGDDAAQEYIERLEKGQAFYHSGIAEA